jgi:signal transduction histidine kinase
MLQDRALHSPLADAQLSLQEMTARHEHLVQFYEREDFLIDQVGHFLGRGLKAGEACLVIATREHREAFEARLRAVRLGACLSPDRYIALDAAETLAKLTVDGWPDARRFTEVIGGAVPGTAGQSRRRLYAFGEMVALLWAEGRHEAALHLEELWNDFARTRRLTLLCAYPLAGFPGAEHGRPFLQVCNAHSQVLPAESVGQGAAAPEELRRQIALLQQKAAALETEVARREQTEQRKDEFLAMLGHELRNPLAAILNASELMRRRGDDPATLALAQAIVARQSVAMSRLVDDLLDVSRINRGKFELRKEMVRIDGIVDRAVELARPLIDEKKHRLTVDLPAEPVSFSADATRLMQLLANLLHNAAKYTDAGGSIRLSARRDGEDLLLSVRDDGMGMTAELREQVFEPFVQAPGSLESARGGLGIGLTLARTIVDLHGGRIEALSDGPGCGSEFVVRLPLLPMVVPVPVTAA